MNPRQDENETCRRRTHTGASIDKEFAEEVARTYHDAGRRQTGGGVLRAQRHAMGSRRRSSVACGLEP